MLAAWIAAAAAVATLVWWGRGFPEEAPELVPRGEPGGDAMAPPPDATRPAAPRRVREPTVAGRFYPDDAGELYEEVQRAMTASPRLGLRGVRAVLVPHPGYVFGAEVAASVFREVDPSFRRVFLIASNHDGRARFAGVSLPDCSHYAIPGAEIPLDPIVEELRADPLFVCEPRAHGMHMLEVELPFLHALRGRPDPVDWGIVPMIVGDLDEGGIDHLAEVLAAHADPETLFVFSVDLSHYHGYERARRLDRYSIDAIMGLDREALDRAETDANQVLMTMVTLAQHLGWEPTLGMERNSGDVIADKSRVVGYVGVALHEPLVLQRRREDGAPRRWRGGRWSAALAVRSPRRPRAPGSRSTRSSGCRRGVFVTLKKQGRLRGCIGRIEPGEPLHRAARDCAVSAASRDERFDPVAPEELEALRVSISILGYPTRVRVQRPEQYLEVLRPEIDGVVHRARGATLGVPARGLGADPGSRGLPLPSLPQAGSAPRRVARSRHAALPLHVAGLRRVPLTRAGEPRPRGNLPSDGNPAENHAA